MVISLLLDHRINDLLKGRFIQFDADVGCPSGAFD
jgi:hypothetical protein